MSTKRTRFLAFGCVHVPLHDRRAVDWCIQRIAEYRPDVIVCLGDLFEADSASRWPSEYTWTLADEYRAADDLLRRVRLAYPPARRVFLPGNHDDNLLAIGRFPSKIRDRCDWRLPQYDARGRQINSELLSYWHRPVEYVYSKRGVYRLGQVTFAHGFDASLNGDEFHTILLGRPYGLFVGAHTHRPTPVTQARRTRSVPLPYWYANVGCLRDLTPHWIRRRASHNWGHGIVTGEVWRGSSHRTNWSAQTEVLRRD